MSAAGRPWIASARMYAVAPAAAATWRELLLRLARRARVPLEILEMPPPAPIATLWAHPRKGAVFMCGLPLSRTTGSVHVLAAPVPAGGEFAGQPRYWSEFVVRADSTHQSLEDTLGGRIAFTSPESQSGFAAPLAHLRRLRTGSPLFREVVAPQVTPQGALSAVAEARADVAPIDAYSLRLLRRFAPELAARVRCVARTESRPIPPLVSSEPLPALAQGFLSAHEDPDLQALLGELRLTRFVQPRAADYDALSREFDETLAYWREHGLASSIDPAFAGLTAAQGEE